jgi:hypothetical protein
VAVSTATCAGTIPSQAAKRESSSKLVIISESPPVKESARLIQEHAPNRMMSAGWAAAMHASKIKMAEQFSDLDSYASPARHMKIEAASGSDTSEGARQPCGQGQGVKIPRAKPGPAERT